MATLLRKTGDAQLEADRWNAAQSARDAATLDVINVMYVVQRLVKEDRYEEARQIVAEYRAQKASGG